MTRRFARRRRIIAPVPRDAFISHASVDLTEVGDVNWRPVIPDALKGAMTNVGIQNQKPESPLKTTPTTRPVMPVKK